MRPFHCLLILFIVGLPSVGYGQTKPDTSGAQSFGEPEMRKHHSGMILPNEPGRPRVGYHKHRRKHHNPHRAY